MAKQIDINGLAEFKKKCDETYAKVGQGGTGDDIYHIIDLGEIPPWGVEDNTLYNKIKSLKDYSMGVWKKLICFKFENVYMPLTLKDIALLNIEQNMLGEVYYLDVSLYAMNVKFILLPNAPYVQIIETSSPEGIESLRFNEKPTFEENGQTLTFQGSLNAEIISQLVNLGKIDTYYIKKIDNSRGDIFPCRLVTKDAYGSLIFQCRITVYLPSSTKFGDALHILDVDVAHNSADLSYKVFLIE